MACVFTVSIMTDEQLLTRNVRVVDSVWMAAQETAARQDLSLSQVVRRLLAQYIDNPRIVYRVPAGHEPSSSPDHNTPLPGEGDS